MQRLDYISLRQEQLAIRMEICFQPKVDPYSYARQIAIGRAAEKIGGDGRIGFNGWRAPSVSEDPTAFAFACFRSHGR